MLIFVESTNHKRGARKVIVLKRDNNDKRNNMRFDLSTSLANCIPEDFGKVVGTLNSQNDLVDYYRPPQHSLVRHPYAADIWVSYDVPIFRYIPNSIVYMLFQQFHWIEKQKNSLFMKCIYNHSYIASAQATFLENRRMYMELYDLQSGLVKFYLFREEDILEPKKDLNDIRCIGTILFKVETDVNLSSIQEVFCKTRIISAQKIQRSWLAAKHNPMYSLCRNLLINDLEKITLVT